MRNKSKSLPFPALTWLKAKLLQINSINPIKILLLVIILHINSYAQVIDINYLINVSKDKEKKLLIYFHMTHCGICKRMKTYINNDRHVKSVIDKDFTILYLNIDDDDTVVYKDFKGSIHKFAHTLDVHMYPSTIFISWDNEVKHNVVGYRDRDKFLTILDYINTDSYESMTLQSFIDEKDFNE